LGDEGKSFSKELNYRFQDRRGLIQRCSTHPVGD
jgi:hypothetical protein